MTAEIATLDKVRAAIEQLHRDGLKATADGVISLIGGGSKPTVLKHMKALRELPQAADSTLPASVLDLLKPVAAQIYAEGARAEERRNREHAERLHRLLGDLEAEVEALAIGNQGLEGQVATLTRQQAEAKAAAAEARETIARQADEISTLRAELAKRHDEAASQIAGLLQGFEATVAGLAERMESTPLRNEKQDNSKG
jgi:DNA repair exonuclease SbcCD ATPase subunit